MLLLILESLGSTELLFILVMALVFFGPRKLPQIGRSLGKNLAEFRRASEEFKRTWDREANLEQFVGPVADSGAALPEENSISDREKVNLVQPPTIEGVARDRVVGPRSQGSDALNSPGQDGSLSAEADLDSATEEPITSTKRDWL